MFPYTAAAVLAITAVDSQPDCQISPSNGIFFEANSFASYYGACGQHPLISPTGPIFFRQASLNYFHVSAVPSPSANRLDLQYFQPYRTINYFVWLGGAVAAGVIITLLIVGVIGLIAYCLRRRKSRAADARQAMTAGTSYNQFA